MARSGQPTPKPIGETLRQRRVEVLDKSLREMARVLDIAPAHLTDLELGRRTPSEDLLLRISVAYGITVAELRAGWNRPDAIVSEVASQDPVTAEKVPELLRSARKLTRTQWDALIEQARHMTGKKDSTKGK
ncbi:MAG: helix-turn-helix transcriptional regulator [Phycisphaerales bacterium]|nr:helix-turn-helix transcriptional regulator [Phycisphaerales bacterium]